MQASATHGEVVVVGRSADVRDVLGALEEREVGLMVVLLASEGGDVLRVHLLPMAEGEPR